MSHKKSEEPSTTDSSNGEDLSAFLLNRLALHDKELEVDKIFRALVKLEGSRFAHESWESADDSHQRRTASSQSASA